MFSIRSWFLFLKTGSGPMVSLMLPTVLMVPLSPSISGKKRPIEGSQTTNPDFVMIRLQERDGLMAIVGECNGRSFEVDLRKYRIVGVIQNVLLDKRYHD